MSKKNKSAKNFGNETPEIYNMDDIGYMTDEAIHDRTNRLEHERNRLGLLNRDPYLWEIEIAYLRREEQLRQTRAERHAEFMKKFVPSAEVNEILESTNPAAQNTVNESN